MTPQFWTDPEDESWGIPMLCDESRCKSRFWYFRQVKKDETDAILNEEEVAVF